MGQRVLVTGASGFIGRNCLTPLLNLGYDVHAVGATCADHDDGHVSWHRANLLEPSQVDQLVSRVEADCLLHLAWIAKPGVAYTSPDNYRWVTASMQLVEGFVRHGGQRVLVAGTCYEYDQRYGWCHEQRTPCKPTTTYGVCKLALRQLLAEYCRVEGVSFCWPRLFFLYGPHEHPQRLVSSVVCSLLQGETAACSHGRQLRDYLYVGDLAEALVALCKSNLSGAINIGSGEPTSLAQIVSRIGQLMGQPERVQLGSISAREHDVPLVAADTTRLQTELNWQPRFDFDTAMQATIDWWESQLQKH